MKHTDLIIIALIFSLLNDALPTSIPALNKGSGPLRINPSLFHKQNLNYKPPSLAYRFKKEEENRPIFSSEKVRKRLITYDGSPLKLSSTFAAGSPKDFLPTGSPKQQKVDEKAREIPFEISHFNPLYLKDVDVVGDYLPVPLVSGGISSINIEFKISAIAFQKLDMQSRPPGKKRFEVILRGIDTGSSRSLNIKATWENVLPLHEKSQKLKLECVLKQPLPFDLYENIEVKFLGKQIFKGSISRGPDLFKTYPYGELDGFPCKLSDFESIRKLGMGSFGQVSEVADVITGKRYALKTMSLEAMEKKLGDKAKTKEFIVNALLLERKVLISSNNPYIMKGVCSFKDDYNLYLLTELVPASPFQLNSLYRDGATIPGITKDIGNIKTVFEEPIIKFLAAQLVLALKFLQERKITHGDLSNNNVMIDKSGFIKLIDFGLIALDDAADTYPANERTSSKLFRAPEMQFGEEYNIVPTYYRAPMPHFSNGMDWWALGVHLYYFAFGDFPVGTDYPIRSAALSIVFPNTIERSDSLKDLISQLLRPLPSDRIGSRMGAEEVMRHEFFEGIDWDKFASQDKSLVPLPLRQMDK